MIAEQQVLASFVAIVQEANLRIIHMKKLLQVQTAWQRELLLSNEEEKHRLVSQSI
ncbi:hypothetical protein G3485_22560 [Shewanella baltica]|jgi:hypothetical protein|uniref:hypothetical protein n=1 Tax=Shewanella baltica TaxID=62322 RepID=UPI0021677B3C|nr:hypothetical protein [Shewanella baltica]MCS6116969.1 hypothetical protein [Shewanella baltica]MCS6129881.1 hypothetical protein [Shewanella baltica]MCS6141790.1 hypothetical protein [Shewanella baltica]MCS6148125.1 hypothetical protein [Shewanella baltica]MCS6172678.1 hypothetical protein [Shewanella baltica]